VVGDGPERSALERLAGTLGIAGRVSFLGRRADVRALLPEADLLLHSAVAEAGAYVIPEAMCAGLPAVVTRAGAASEQVDDGRTGFVLARDDLAGFANRLAQLASDPSLRRSLGAAARQRWAERYRLNDAARAYADLYRRVARGG
jgi:glycosyltransferase involved in cell wall biosynthesis